MKAIIKWRGQKKIVDVKIDVGKSFESERLIYLVKDYCVFVSGDQTYHLSLDGIRNYEELEEACA